MTRLTIENGWLAGVRQVRSPNHDARPAGSRVDTLVVHGITLPPGCFGRGQVDALFTNALDPSAHPYYAAIAHLKVSAHALIERTGRITQYVSFEARAWHAGRSCFDGREAVNDFGIGIELEGTDDQPFDDRQYTALSELTRALKDTYPITGIAGHADIAPGRKTDPGPCFDWTRYRKSCD